MATGPVNPESMSEEQLRAAYEQEIKQVRIEQVLLEDVVTLVNLGLRRSGLMPGTEDERDLAQVQLAIEAVRALMPQVDQIAPEQSSQIHDALAQLQLAFVQAGGAKQGAGAAGPAAPPTSGQGAGAAGPPPPSGAASGRGAQPGSPGVTPPRPPQPPPKPGEPGPAQKSGRLWVPGQ